MCLVALPWLMMGIHVCRALDGDPAWKRKEYVEPFGNYSWTQPEMQIYASFKYRRDLARIAQVCSVVYMGAGQR